MKAAALFLVGCLLIAGLPISAAADGTSHGDEIIFLSNEKTNLFVGMFDHYDESSQTQKRLLERFPQNDDKALP